MPAEILSDTETAARPRARPATAPGAPRRRSWVTVAALGAIALSFVILTADWFFETSFFLDDYIVCGSAQDGVGDVLATYWEETGPYRPITYPVVTFRKLTCGAFWIHKVIGLGLHLAVGFLLFRLATRLGMGRLGGVAATTVWVFNPLVYEAAAWPAPVYGYPLAALLVVLLALELIREETRIWLAALLALGAFMANEVTLGLIGVLPLLLGRGDVVDRIRTAVRVLWPSAAYLAILTVSARFIPNPRPSAFGVDGLTNLVTELGWLQDGFLPLAPFGSLWRAMAKGPVDGHYVAAVVVFVAGVVALLAVAAETRRGRRPAPLGVAVVSLGLAVVAMLPFVVQGEAFTTPRYAYLASAPIAIAAAALVAPLSASKPLVWVGAILPVAWVLAVGDGLVAEAAAFDVAFANDRATATAMAEAAGRASPDRIVLVNTPWSTVDAPIVGHHIVHPFVVPWAAPGALELLGGYHVDGPIPVDLGGTVVCSRNGVLEVAGGPPAAGMLIYDVQNRTPVGGFVHPDGSYESLAPEGSDLPLPACSP